MRCIICNLSYMVYTRHYALYIIYYISHILYKESISRTWTCSHPGPRSLDSPALGPSVAPLHTLAGPSRPLQPTSPFLRSSPRNSSEWPLRTSRSSEPLSSGRTPTRSRSASWPSASRGSSRLASTRTLERLILARSLWPPPIGMGPHRTSSMSIEGS